MARLYFYFAAMNAEKSTTLLQADCNYRRDQGMRFKRWSAHFPARRRSAVRFLAALAVLLFAAAPLSAAPLTVRMGETWVFTIANGQPAGARKVDAQVTASPGQMKVTLSPLMGTTMTISNHSRFDYAYRATLILPGGRDGSAKSCAVPAHGRLAMEHWPQRVAAVRLSDFKPAPAGSLCP